MPNKLTPFFGQRLPQADDRLVVRRFGWITERPDDARGDSHNYVAIGGRFDCVSEALAARRERANARAERAEAVDTRLTVVEAHAARGMADPAPAA